MPTDPTKHISLFANPQLRDSVKSLASKLISDHAFRESFIADPTSALKHSGIPMDTALTLTERDKLLLRLIGDKSIETLYKTGDIGALRKHIIDNYKGIAVAGSSKADVAADFDVLIETEVVAVAEVAAVVIAVADIVARPGEQVQVESNAVVQARIAALEARIQMLETQLAARG